MGNVTMGAEPARTTDVAALALDHVDRLVVGTVRDMHGAVSRRAFRATRLVGSGIPERVHDAVAGTVYGALSGTLRVTSGSVRALSARGVGAPVESSRAGRSVVAAVNGLIGDDLRELDDRQTISMAVRHAGKDLVPTRWQLAEAFRGTGGHLVVFLHGLCESEETWNLRQKQRGSTYPQRLQAETGATPVMIRYNTGLAVAENGKHLDSLLRALVDQWPTRVTRITLVGHSMGGLVARAATNYATADGAIWQQLVRDVVCLGSPHTGAALEKAVHLGSATLRIWPETAPFGAILQTRSRGITDLRHGYVSQQEWTDQELTARWGSDRIAVASLPGAKYHFIAATLGSSTTHPMSMLLGDLLVHFSSVVGGHGRASGEGIYPEHVPSTHHFALLNHPTIADWLVRWVNADDRQRRRLTEAADD